MRVSHRKRTPGASKRRIWSVETLEQRWVLSGGITEFPVAPPPPGQVNGVEGITSGPDGALWFTLRGAGAIGSISTTGTVTTDPLPNSSADPQPLSIAAGPDGNLWFTEPGAGAIGRFDPTTHVFETFPLGAGIHNPETIVLGPDGNLWFTDSVRGQIGQITPQGVISDFSAAPLYSTYSITVGPDGALWFTGSAPTTPGLEGAVGRITTSGQVALFPVSGGPVTITSGPDGNLWFIDVITRELGRITPQGVVTEFPTTPIGLLDDITTGPDGSLWFASQTEIGQISSQGVLSEYGPITSGGPAYRITTGPDGNLWFAQDQSNTIGRVNLSPPATPPAPTPEILMATGPTSISPARLARLFEKPLLDLAAAHVKAVRVHHPARPPLRTHPVRTHVFPSLSHQKPRHKPHSS